MTTMEERFRQRPLEEKIEALTKERDDAWLQNTEIDARCAKLEAAAKLALEALEQIHPYDLDCSDEIAALRQAGVQ